jgi:hypothetical protein
LTLVTIAPIHRILRRVPDHNDDRLSRLKRASEALDAAQKAARITVQEVARAKQSMEQARKDARLHDTSPARERKLRARKHR